MIHPADEKAAVPDVGGSILYKLGAALRLEGGTLHMDGPAAVFIEK